MHPLANVDIVGRGDGIRRLRLYSCSGDQVDLELEAKGTPPLTLNYLKSWGSRSENITIDIKPGRSRIPIPIPAELSSDTEASGKLSVVLVSIRDGDGRSRQLPAPILEVDIQRQKPTVRFAKSEKVIITEGDTARAPLRLSGDAPWEVSYTFNGGREKKVILRDANNYLTLAEEGIYRLTKVAFSALYASLTRRSKTLTALDLCPRPRILSRSPSSHDLKWISCRTRLLAR